MFHSWPQSIESFFMVSWPGTPKASRILDSWASQCSRCPCARGRRDARRIEAGHVYPGVLNSGGWKRNRWLPPFFGDAIMVPKISLTRCQHGWHGKWWQFLWGFLRFNWAVGFPAAPSRHFPSCAFSVSNDYVVEQTSNQYQIYVWLSKKKTAQLASFWLLAPPFVNQHEPTEITKAMKKICQKLRSL